MNVRFIALWAAVLPFLGVHLSYLVAASTGAVDWCVPYWDSCTSISATGRHAPASYIFRGTMLPAAAFIALYWVASAAWLAAVQRGTSQATGSLNHWMVGLGVVACVGLVLYVSVLGEPGHIWRQQRRIGTVLFFSFTFLAQLLLVAQVFRLGDKLTAVQRHAQVMFRLCMALLFLGLLTVILDSWDEAFYESVEDAFEWVLALLLQLNFLLGYLMWRRCGWTLEVNVKTTGPDG